MDNNNNQNIIPFERRRRDNEPLRPDIDRDGYWREEGDILEDGNRTRIRVGFLMNEQLEEYFKRCYPNIQLLPTTQATPHSHARLAFERSYGEGIIYAQLPAGYTTDIGGNARRHHDRRRRNVHCCCPVLSAEDATRVHRYQGLLNWCTNKFQDCVVQADNYIAIHSLYYLNPEDVMYAVRNSTNHRLYSLHHMFNDAYGSFAEGEAQYMLGPDLRITMYSHGNLTPYHHSNMAWLSTGYYQSLDGRSAMAWTIVQSLPNSVVMLFTPAPRGLPMAINPDYRGFQPMLKDNKYYGPVPLTGAAFHSALDNAASVELVNSTIHVDTLYSYGKFMMGVDSERVESCVVPKGFIDEMAAWMALKSRDATTLSTLIAHARVRIKSYNMPPHMLTKAIIFGVALGYTLHVDTESAVMSSVLNDYVARFPILNTLLRLELPYKLPNWLPTVISALLTLPLLKWRNPYTVSSSIVGSVLTAVFLLRHWRIKSRPSPQQQYLNAMQSRETNHTNFAMPDYGAVALDANVLVSGVVGDNALRPLHPAYDGGPMPVVTDFSQDEKLPKKSLTGGGIIIPEYMPNVNANCATNDRLALFNRGLDVKRHPNINYDTFSSEFLGLHFDLLFPGPLPQVQYDFEAWNNRFPPATRTRHQRIYDVDGDELADPKRALTLKSFMKMEMLLNATPTKYKESDPRLIQGGQDTFNVYVGPWVWSFSKALATVWNFTQPIHYSAGSTGEAIGVWFDLIGHHNPDYIDSETDFSRYDTTQSRSKLMRTIFVMSKFGVPSHICRFLEQAIRRHGATSNGIVYRIDATMASGRPETSCGNSISNAVDTVINLQINNEDVPTKELLHKMKLIVLGDDNVLRRHGSLAPLSARVYQYAGLNSELVQHTNSYDVTFCSSRFWPTNQGTILGPKVSRMAAKIGWVVNTPEHLVPGVLRSKVLSLENHCRFVPPLNSICQTMKKVLSREKKRDGYADPGQYSISAKAFPTLATWSMLEYLHEYTKQDQARLDSVLATVSSLPTVLTGDVLAKFIAKDGEFPVTANIVGLLSQHSEEALNSATTCCLDLLTYVLSPCLEEIIKRYKVGNVPVGLLFPVVEYVAFIATFHKKVGPGTTVSSIGETGNTKIIRADIRILPITDNFVTGPHHSKPPSSPSPPHPESNTMSQRVARGERMLAKFAEKVGMTQEGREFVTAAIDPFHDTPLNVCGFPDGNRDPVAVQIVKQSFNIACPSAITTGTWDAQLVLLPWNKNLKLTTQSLLGGTNSNPTNEMIVTSSGVGLTAGGLMAISVPTGTSFNPGVAPPASNSIVYQPFVIPDQYLQGDTRIIGKAFEVHNTTSALNIQGMATTWSIPVPDIETSGLYQWELDTSGTFTLVTPVSAQQIPAWPTSQAAAVLTPGARQWTAAQGSYVVARLQSNNIPVSDTGFPIQPFLSFGDTSQSNLNLAPSPNTGTNSAIRSFNNVFWDNTEMCGVVFSGLSLQTTLTINVNWIVERHPDTTISDLVVLAKPPPERDDIALTMYSHLSAALPTGVPVAENGFGDWFMDALSTAADIITPVTSLLPGIGGVISKGISSVNDSYKASKVPKAVAKQIAEEVVEEKYETNPFVKPPTRPMWDAKFNNHGVLTETLVGGTKAQRVAARQRAAEINMIRRNHTKSRRSVNPFKGNSIPR